jgi:hypothetical protein
MRKTLLAVGVAVLVSMMVAPHGGKGGIEGWGPFFSAQGFDVRSGGIWYHETGRVMIDMLALEMVFLAVLFAVIVNNTHIETAADGQNASKLANGKEPLLPTLWGPDLKQDLGPRHPRDANDDSSSSPTCWINIGGARMFDERQLRFVVTLVVLFSCLGCQPQMISGYQIVKSASSGLKVAARLSPPDSTKHNSACGNFRFMSSMAARFMEASSRIAV